MKYIITNSEIELIYYGYKIIVPNDPSFKCIFCDIRKFMGAYSDPYVGIYLKSKAKRYIPWYGVILYYISFMRDGVSTENLNINIYGLENSEKFLLEAKDKGYNVDEALNKLTLAKEEKITFFGKDAKVIDKLYKTKVF